MDSATIVPFLDLKTQYRAISAEVLREIAAICDDAAFVLGPKLRDFEEAFSQFIGAKYCVGVASGTDALRLAFEAIGLQAGDEVIIPAHTFVATAVGVLEAGGIPRLADVSQETYLLDMPSVESALSPKTKAICPVHLYGRICDMDQIMRFAEQHNLLVIEDAAQAHGARWRGTSAGNFGAVGCFSFYPGKNLGAYGDGGAITTSSELINAKIRRLRNYGSETKYQHPEKGINSRLDSIQAAVLQIKLERLRQWNLQRWQIAAQYQELLAPLQAKGVILPDIMSKEEHVFHLYVIRVANRERVVEFLTKHGVQTGIHYPIPFHLQDGVQNLKYPPGAFPVTEKICNEILSLPMFPELTAEQQSCVAKSLEQAIDYAAR